MLPLLAMMIAAIPLDRGEYIIDLCSLVSINSKCRPQPRYSFHFCWLCACFSSVLMIICSTVTAYIKPPEDYDARALVNFVNPHKGRDRIRSKAAVIAKAVARDLSAPSTRPFTHSTCTTSGRSSTSGRKSNTRRIPTGTQEARSEADGNIMLLTVISKYIHSQTSGSATSLLPLHRSFQCQDILDAKRRRL